MVMLRFHCDKAGKSGAIRPVKMNVKLRSKATPGINPPFDWFTKESVDFSKMSNARTKHEYYYPFDHEISSQAMDLRVLKARGIGQRGALCLAADFVRTQLPQLEILDLSNCEMQTRGVGRVLRGVKLAKYQALEILKLSGNHITCRGLEYVRDILDCGLFEQLRVLDLSDNELGDACAESFIRMIFAGSLSKLQELHLQNNFIKDVGFSKLMRVLKSVCEELCPHLTRLGLERNPITARVKIEYAPLPAFVSI
jgi:Ran GTPase-activating protein (RanGAP) involved in mRNA processing and transport